MGLLSSFIKKAKKEVTIQERYQNELIMLTEQQSQSKLKIIEINLQLKEASLIIEENEPYKNEMEIFGSLSLRARAYQDACQRKKYFLMQLEKEKAVSQCRDERIRELQQLCVDVETSPSNHKDDVGNDSDKEFVTAERENQYLVEENERNLQEELERQRIEAENERKRKEELERQRVAAEEERKRKEQEEKKIAQEKANRNKAHNFVNKIIVQYPFIENIKAPLSKLVKVFYDAKCNILRATDYVNIKNNCEAEIIKIMESLSAENPVLCQLNIPESPKGKWVETILSNIKKNALKQYCFPAIPLSYTKISYPSYYEHNNILVPNYISLAQSNNAYVYNDACFEDVKNKFESYLLNIILSMPIGKVRLSIIDMEFNYSINSLTSKLPNEICPNIYISDNDSLRDLLDGLDRQCQSVIPQYDDIQEFNKSQRTILYPYTIVILTDSSTAYSGNISERLKRLIKQGRRAGIFFMALVHEDNTKALDGMKILKGGDLFSSDDAFYHNTPIYNNPCLRDAAFQYISDECNKLLEERAAYEESIIATRKSDNRIISMDYESLMRMPYASANGGIKVEIGNSEEGKAYFELDTTLNPHAFVLGSTGSGKSVFLHDIIAGIEMTYAPEDVQLYLLDMKIGGVEFDRYKNTPHAKVVLADCSDMEITLEILREIKSEMDLRGRLFKQSCVQNINDYNKYNNSDHLPHLVVVADECQKLFMRESNVPRVICDEIQMVLKTIAKEGRSQGIHMILATQTLVGTDINAEILNNINVKYLLKSSVSDAAKLVNGVRDEVTKLAAGEALHFSSEGVNKIKSYYAKDLSPIIDAICQKANGHISGNKFYFSGSMTYPLVEDGIVETLNYDSPSMVIGKELNLNLEDIKICFKKQMAENALVIGINDHSQVMRTSFNMFVSAIIHAKKTNQALKCYLMNFLEDDNDYYNDLLADLRKRSLCDVVSRSGVGSCLKQLALSIKQEQQQKVLLFIIGQDRFKELDRNEAIDRESNSKPSFTSMFAMPTNGSGLNAGNDDCSISGFKDALNIILDDGPQYGIHTIMQLERFQNFLFDEYANKRQILKKFAHVVMLRSEDRAGSLIGDDIKPSALCSDSERLRAYYYNDNINKLYLFTPYMDFDKHQLETLFMNL